MQHKFFVGDDAVAVFVVAVVAVLGVWWCLVMLLTVSALKLAGDESSIE